LFKFLRDTLLMQCVTHCQILTVRRRSYHPEHSEGIVLFSHTSWHW